MIKSQFLFIKKDPKFVMQKSLKLYKKHTTRISKKPSKSINDKNNGKRVTWAKLRHQVD
jgi:hypothetical protein